MAVVIKAKTPTVDLVRFGKTNDAKVYSKEYLGGKGANLCEMAALGIPVPPGVIVPCDVSVKYQKAATSNVTKIALLNGTLSALMDKMSYLTECFGYMPLVSVRSGARVSMPGMMDTILNVGLTEANFDEWAQRIGTRAAMDSRRRLIQMLGSVAYGVQMEKFEHILQAVKDEAGVKSDSELSAENLATVVKKYLALFEKVTGSKFPDTLRDQLSAAVRAVFNSWNNPRAVEYRKIHGYSDDWGTAVVVQSMVFGNMNDKSCTGVVFTRCPSTGVAAVTGEYLVNAQGEDVVAGIRTPDPIHSMAAWNNAVKCELYDILEALEQHYRDMQDVEFTVQDGKLYILQTRTGKRSAQAAFKIAHDLAVTGMITHKMALSRVTSDLLKAANTPKIDPKFAVKPHLTGIAAGGGVVSGVAMFSSANAVNCTEPCILVTKETTPDDIAGMNASLGILTATGGLTSHAAVVARGMNKSCVVGATDLTVSGNVAFVSGAGISSFTEGQKITIDGATGRVWVGIDVPVVGGALTPEMQAMVSWAADFTPNAHLRITPTQDEADWEYCIAQSEGFKMPVFVDMGLVGPFAVEFLNKAMPRMAEAGVPSVRLDFSPAVINPTDEVFSVMVGSSTGGWDDLIDLIDKSVALNDFPIPVVASGSSLTPPLLKVLKAHGASTMAQISTFADLFTVDNPVASEDTIEKVFGGKKYYELALKLVSGHTGKTPGASQCNPLYWFQIL